MRVVVTGLAGAGPAVAAAVTAVGGHVEAPLQVIDGVTADVPAGAVDTLRAAPGVRSVTADTRGRLQGVDPALGYDAGADEGSLYDVAQITHARDAWTKGWTGKGVDVALIDSGVAPVQGLTSGNVVQGPDLSFESQDPDLVHRDTFGHGTHMAVDHRGPGRRRHGARTPGRQPPVHRHRPRRSAGLASRSRPPTAEATSVR